jgi:transposase-like protein
VGQKKQPKFTDEFKREAVRILLSSDRSLAEVAADLGIGKSTLGRWKSEQQEAELLAGPHDDMAIKLKRLKKENELLLS